jgi:hypothetical protein
MHDALSTHLGDALAVAFSAVGSADDDDAVWRIRKLTLDVTVNAQWDAAHLARVWADRLAYAVRRAMATGGDGVTVMRWPSTAAYLASFVREAANGTAWSRWWFDSFSGLRLLARSAQIRTALVRAAPIGATALTLMSAADVGLVVAQLSTPDARMVLDALAPASSADATDSAATALLAALRALDSSPRHADEERWSLRLVVEALRDRPWGTAGPLASVARAMARLSTVADEQSGRMGVVRRLLNDGNAGGLRLVLGNADAERLAPLAHASRVVVGAIAEQFAATALAGTAPARAADNDAWWMPIGAPFMLAPFAAALPLDDATRGWPAIGSGDEPADCCASAASLVRLLAMATACGGERAARILADSTARRLAGVGKDVSGRQLRDWVAQLGVTHAARLEWTVGGWRAATGTISNDTWLLADAAESDDQQVTPMRLALIDCSRGHWLAVRDDADGQLSGSVRALRHWLRPVRVDAPRELLVRDERHLPFAMTLAPASVDVRPAADGLADSRLDVPVAATLARHDRLVGELNWLALPASLGVPRPLELALAVVAQGLLRDLAWRLPGFARASLPHLWTNFLAVDAHVEQQPERLIARLGRPPLVMVIAMTGLMRSNYRLPWLGAMPIALFPSDTA